MKVTFCGAAQTVTGSCYFVETGKNKFLVDCGMFQGPKHIKALNYRSFMFNPADVDFVILTHAHIDHSGLLPKLVKDGFKGKIYSTAVTAELSAIMLPDSAHIQEHDVDIANRKAKRSGRLPISPLYSVADAERSLGHFEPLEYGSVISIGTDIELVFREAGHILGSAVVELMIRNENDVVKLVFSGDLGQYHQPIVRDPDYITTADYLFIESTYGLRERTSFSKEDEFARALNMVIDRGGNCVIPAFAVGRTQLVLYYLVKLMKNGNVPKVPVYLDSPLGIAATRIFGRHPEVYDEDAKQTLRLDKMLSSDEIDLHYAISVDESKRINETPGAKIIISSSGMADAGRILHHLKHNLWNSRNGVFFMGYQADGTVGRRLVEGIDRIKIAGEEIAVRAEIFNFDGFSAHADRSELLDWLKHFDESPRNVFVTHGEADSAVQFAADVQKIFGYPTYAPAIGDLAVLGKNSFEITKTDIAIPYDTQGKLQNFFVLVEMDYMDLRRRLEQMIEKNPQRLPEIVRRLEKLHNVFVKMSEKLK